MVPADRTHVVARKNADLAGVHGCSFKPPVLTALQYQEHLALSQLQLVLLTGCVREHCNIPERPRVNTHTHHLIINSFTLEVHNLAHETFVRSSRNITANHSQGRRLHPVVTKKRAQLLLVARVSG